MPGREDHEFGKTQAAMRLSSGRGQGRSCRYADITL